MIEPRLTIPVRDNIYETRPQIGLGDTGGELAYPVSSEIFFLESLYLLEISFITGSLLPAVQSDYKFVALQTDL